jgi:F-box-like
MAMHNDAIAPSAACMARAQRLDIERALADIAAETQSLQRERAALDRSIQWSWLHVDGLRSDPLYLVFSPIRRLPAEIVGQILGNIPANLWMLDKKDQAALCRARRVCKRWDAIAKADRTLWRGLKMQGNTDDSDDQPPPDWDMAERWLSRAVGGLHRLCATDLWLRDVQEESDFFTFILTTKTWSDLELELPLGAGLLLLLNLQHKDYTNWNMLTYLKITLQMDTSGNMSEISIDFKTHGLLPSLNDLHISYPYTREDRPDLPLALSHATLTSLTIWDSRFHDFRTTNPSLLVPINLPQLQTLTLIDVAVDGGREPNPNAVYHTLQSLSISGLDAGSLEPLRRMTMPNLNRLHLSDLSGWFLRQDTASFFRRFLQRSTRRSNPSRLRSHLTSNQMSLFSLLTASQAAQSLY